MGISLGGGSSSGGGTTTVQQTPEQAALLKAQTGFLTGTAFPAYQRTLGMANDVYGQANPAAINAANTAMQVAQRSGAQQEVAGGASLGLGLRGLASLFSPQYKQEQINSALQAGRESGRELVNQQVAGYGAAGGLGSSRAALANANLASLQEQRQGNVAATVGGQIEQNRAAAANQLSNIGLQALTGAQQAAANRIGFAQTPQDVLSKYASIIYGTPQGSTTPNFANTQGTTTSGASRSKGFGIS